MTAAQNMANVWLCAALGLSEPDTPFPWQVRLLAEFARGLIPGALDIPTGLGKTAVIAIWAVARAVAGAKVPSIAPGAVTQVGETPALKIRGQWRIACSESDPWTDAQVDGGEEGRDGQ